MVGQAVLVLAIIAGAKSIKYLNPWSSNSPRMRLFRGMAYGAVSGILSAHSLLVAKSAVELLVRTIVDKHNQFNRWQSWMILLGLLILAVTQLYYLHRGLKLCSTSILYPFIFCVYNIIAILDGLIYFHQTSQLTLLDALLVRPTPTHHDLFNPISDISPDRPRHYNPSHRRSRPLLAPIKRSHNPPSCIPKSPDAWHGLHLRLLRLRG